MPANAPTKFSVAATIAHFNSGRDPERLALKYNALRKNPFSFLRGTCHLFWSEAPESFWTSAVPVAWACGDLHLENFGCYKADDRRTYFDVNDFDEAIAAPCYADPVRLMCSILVAAENLKMGKARARTLCEVFMTSYAKALQSGKPRSIDRATAEGPALDLLNAACRRTRSGLLDGRTESRGGKRRLRTDGKKALPVDTTQRASLQRFMTAFASRQDNPEFFRLIDVARRISGTGSLGVERYVLLVEGKGSPERNYLLDLKEAQSSVLAQYVAVSQPKWKSEADRVVKIQRHVQAVSPAFLHSVELNGKSFTLRALQPSEDRLNLGNVKGDIAGLRLLVATMATLVAGGQLRSSGWRGSATSGELIAFGYAVDTWRPVLIELAENFAARAKTDWRAFRDNPPLVARA